MGLTYNKDYTPRNKRVTTSGPRDRQIKQSRDNNPISTLDGELVETLKSQIALLQEQLSKKITGYTDDQVNNILAKTIKDETKKLNEEIASLKEIIKNKDELISTLKNQSADYNKLTTLLAETTRKLNSGVVVPENVEVGPDRPTMEEVFVDPSTPADGELESHIGVDVVPGSEKKHMEDKANKLKNLLGGKLPKKG